MTEKKNLTAKENSQNIFQTIQIQHRKKKESLATRLSFSKPNDIVTVIHSFLTNTFPLILETKNNRL